MTDDKMESNANDRGEQEKPEQVRQQIQQNQAGAAPRPDQRVTPGRRPLFRS
jgi:hypothetical protein